MSYIHRCLVVPAALAPTVRGMCAGLAGPPGEGMFTVGLSADGTAPATHFISSGPIEDTFAGVLADPHVMFDACQAGGVADATLEVCTGLLAACDVSEQQPFEALERLGLHLLISPA